MGSDKKNLSRKDFLKSLAWSSAAAIALPACNLTNTGLSASLQSSPSTTPSSNIVTALVSAKNVINVKDYGAKGDGVTDDTAAIQSAIQSNAVILFPAGTYLISNTIQIAAGLTNVHISAESAVIKSTNLTTYLFQMNQNAFVTVTGGEYTRADPITFTSPSDQAAFRFISCTDVIVQNVFINGSPGMGICLMNCQGAKIINNIIKNTTRDGVYSHYGVNLLYSGNYLENIKDDALSMHDYGINSDKQDIIAAGYPQAGNSIICNNKIKNAMRGIASIGLQALTVTGNVIEHLPGPGISIFNTAESFEGPDTTVQDIIISDNQVSYACLNNLTFLGGTYSNGNQNGNGKAAISVGSYDANYQYELNLRRLIHVQVNNNLVVNCACNGFFVNNDGVMMSNNTARNCNSTPLAPYTGYIFEAWNCTGFSAFNNSVIDTNATPQAIGGCRTWNTTGITGGWMVTAFSGSAAYVGLAGNQTVNVIAGSGSGSSTSVPAVKY
jgi:hypothetical protein